MRKTNTVMLLAKILAKFLSKALEHTKARSRVRGLFFLVIISSDRAPLLYIVHVYTKSMDVYLVNNMRAQRVER